MSHTHNPLLDNLVTRSRLHLDLKNKTKSSILVVESRLVVVMTSLVNSKSSSRT